MSVPRRTISIFGALILSSCSNNLSVPHIRQETLLCVPTSAAMILSYYGDPKPPRMLKALASGKVYDANVPFDDFSITRYHDLIEGLKKLGYQWTEEDLNDDDEGFSDGMNIIKSEIDEGRPVMIDMTLPSGHTVVINGINMLEKTVNVVDPDQPDPGSYPVNFEQLKTYWNEEAYGHHMRSMIITKPKNT